MQMMVDNTESYEYEDHTCAYIFCITSTIIKCYALTVTQQTILQSRNQGVSINKCWPLLDIQLTINMFMNQELI